MNKEVDRHLSIREFCNKNNYNCDTCENVHYNDYMKENYYLLSLDPCRMTCDCASDNVCLDYRPKEQEVRT